MSMCMCRDCLCMSCTVWEACLMYARCEQAEISSCSQRKECDFYRSSIMKKKETNEQKKGETNHE